MDAGRRSGRIALLCTSLALAGCTTAYQPRGFAGGYSDLQLGRDTYRVSFQGNGYTRQEQVNDFVLLRAAELALERGATRFAVVNQDRSRDATIVRGGQTTGTLTPGLGNSYQYSATTSAPEIVNKHRAELVIQLVPNDAPAPGTYSAQLIRDQLRQRYGLK